MFIRACFKVRVSQSFCVCSIRDVSELESVKRPSVCSLGVLKKNRVSKSFCVCVVSRDVLEMESLKRPSVFSLGDVLKTEFHKVDECVQ